MEIITLLHEYYLYQPLYLRCYVMNCYWTKNVLESALDEQTHKVLRRHIPLVHGDFLVRDKHYKEASTAFLFFLICYRLGPSYPQ